jgi:hypothetical protein
LFVGLSLLLLSCSHELEVTQTPSNLIPKDSMEIILGDMMLVESYMRVKHINVKDYHGAMIRSGNEILDQYNIDSLRYVESLTYYSKKQEVLDEIYEGVKIRLKLDTIVIK